MSVSFSEALRVWLRVALQSFGGPAGQIAVMHRILVEEKRWIGEDALPARAQLLHAAARPRGAAARDVHRLAAARHARAASSRAASSCCPASSRSSRSASSTRRSATCRVVDGALLRSQGRGARGRASRRCCASASARCKNGAMVAIAAAAFVAIFFLERAVPAASCSARGSSGSSAARAAPRRLLPSIRPKAPAGRRGRRSLDALLDGAGARARAAVARPRAPRRCSSGSRSGSVPVALLALALGPDDVFVQIGALLQQGRRRHVRRRVRRARLRRAAGGRDLRLAPAGRDARRPRAWPRRRPAR